MNQMFRELGVQAEFEATGFVKLPWLNEDAGAELRELYGRLTAQTPDGFGFSVASPHSQLKAAVRQGILRVFEPRMLATFVDPLPLLCSFMTKTRGDGKTDYIPSHQDWTFVDETLGDASVNIWCPLEETHERSGNLLLVPRSNRLRRYPRPAEISNSTYKPYWHALRQAETAVPTKLGEAILFDSAVVHASSPNQTDSLRLVASAIVVSRSAKPVLYYQNADDDSMVDEYLSGVDYFLEKPFGTRPDTFLRSIRKTAVLDIEDELRGFYPDVNLGVEYR